MFLYFLEHPHSCSDVTTIYPKNSLDDSGRVFHVLTEKIGQPSFCLDEGRGFGKSVIIKVLRKWFLKNVLQNWVKKKTHALSGQQINPQIYLKL